VKVCHNYTHAREDEALPRFVSAVVCGQNHPGRAERQSGRHDGIDVAILLVGAVHYWRRAPSRWQGFIIDYT
jgi:hypothetical protein